jgi:hypothetical protein
MADSSTIEWTDATWNPVTGCTKISAGCDHCYAERFSERFRGVPGHPFETGFDLTLRPARLQQPLLWRQPRMIFVNSMSDLFHKEIPAPFIEAVFDTMENSLRRGLDYYTTRLKNQPHWQQVYIDAFAGPGLSTIRTKPREQGGERLMTDMFAALNDSDPVEEEVEYLKGSPRVALDRSTDTSSSRGT